MSVGLKYLKYYKHIIKLLFSYPLTSLNKKKFLKKIMIIPLVMSYFYFVCVIL